MATAVMHDAEPAGAAPLADARTWAAPVFDGEAVPAGRGRRLSDEAREEERRLFAEAQQRGHAAGLAAGQKQVNEKLAALEAQGRSLVTALEALSRPLAQLDDRVHEQIALLAMRIARAVVRRELRTDPSQVIGIVRDTVALLPAATRGPRVLLHPEDARLVRERIVPSGPEAGWSIVDDPALGRGDCRVLTDHAQVDARIDTRMQEALTALLGEERTQSRGEDESQPDVSSGRPQP